MNGLLGRMNTLNEIVIEHLPKFCKRHTPDIIAGVVSVDIGLKPAYLLDCCSVSPSTVNDLLRTLHRHRIVKQRLAVLTVESENFIVHVKMLRRHLQQLSENKEIALVDVSSQLKLSEMLSAKDCNTVTATYTEACISSFVYNFCSQKIMP